MRLELLAASTRLFFRRPGEMQHMLGRLLDAAIADASFIDVHDRGLMYYRLLQHDVHKAAEILTQPSNVEGSFVEETQSELSDRIFEEFNTCATHITSGTPVPSPLRLCLAALCLAGSLCWLSPEGFEIAISQALGHLRRARRAFHHQRARKEGRRKRRRAIGCGADGDGRRAARRA